MSDDRFDRYVATKIRRFIFALDEGKAFVVRELLHFGSRAAVDSELYRLVRQGKIVRVTWGVYCRPKYDSVTWPPPDGYWLSVPPTRVIAFVKAKAFDRCIWDHPSSFVAEKHPLLPTDVPQELVFYTNGASSSFKTWDGKVIKLKKTSPRRMKLCYSYVGKTINWLWDQKARNFKDELLRKAVYPFTRDETDAFTSANRWMPQWMSDPVLQTNCRRC